MNFVYLQYKVLEYETQFFPARLEKLHEALSILDIMLEGHTYAVGNKITIADHGFAASLTCMEETRIDIKKHKNVFSYMNRLEKFLPGYEITKAGAREWAKFLGNKFPDFMK